MDENRHLPEHLRNGDPQGIGGAPTVDMESEGAASESTVVTPTSGQSRFRIVRHHTGGSLGQIFIAVDLELGREVALKEMQPHHLDNPALRARFLREAEISGHLEHPNIVPVYGRGTSSDGRPFYAMRLIRGESLWQAIQGFHADTPRLDTPRDLLKLRRLLGRFIDACNAIAYAHSRGVLHRDLKPSNVMLGPYGETLIVDWGLARVTGDKDEDCGQGGEAALTLPPRVDERPTIAGIPLGTPGYMSPEQAEGDLGRLGPRTDIYGLGAILYALLTGRPPVPGGDLEETLDRVKRGAIEPPRSIDERIPRPLEAVCLKALSLRPEDRYRSARRLADDIERWLADEPVSVFPEPLWTRLSRWSRRHKRLVGGFAGLLIMAVLALGVSTAVVNAQKRAAQQARRDAELAKSQAEDHLRLGLEVVEALVTLGDKQLISPKESTATREQLLSRALIFIRRFRERRSEDPAIQAESAQVARRLANLYRLRGEFAQAEPSYDEAITLIEDLRQRYPGRRSFDDLLAENLLDAGESLSMIGRAAAAEELFRRAHGIAEQLTAGSDRASMYRRTWGRSLYRLASVGLALGREDAPSHAREAVEQLRTLADASLPGVRDEVMGGQILPLTDQIELVIAQGIQAEGSHRAGLDSEAERQLREALGRMDRLVDQFRDIPIDDIAYFHATTSIELCRLLIERQAGTQDEPLPRLDDAIARLTNIVERSATIRHFRATLGQAYTVRARAHELSRRLDLSKADAGRAREILESLVARYPTIFDHLSELAEVHDTLGRVALARGDREAATREFEEALRLHQKAIEAAPANPLYRERLSKHQAAVVRRAG